MLKTKTVNPQCIVPLSQCNHPRARTQAHRECAIIKGPGFAPCHEVIHPDPFYHACIQGKNFSQVLCDLNRTEICEIRTETNSKKIDAEILVANQFVRFLMHMTSNAIEQMSWD